MLLQEADSGLPSSFCWYRTQALRRLLLRSVMQTIPGADYMGKQLLAFVMGLLTLEALEGLGGREIGRAHV